MSFVAHADSCSVCRVISRWSRDTGVAVLRARKVVRTLNATVYNNDFCTVGGSDPSRIRHLAQLCGAAPSIVNLTVSARACACGLECALRVGDFLNRIFPVLIPPDTTFYSRRRQIAASRQEGLPAKSYGGVVASGDIHKYDPERKFDRLLLGSPPANLLPPEILREIRQKGRSCRPAGNCGWALARCNSCQPPCTNRAAFPTGVDLVANSRLT